jgi:hypothetical protein
MKKLSLTHHYEGNETKSTPLVNMGRLLIDQGQQRLFTQCLPSSWMVMAKGVCTSNREVRVHGSTDKFSEILDGLQVSRHD